jgi:hypothetical protein
LLTEKLVHKAVRLCVALASQSPMYLRMACRSASLDERRRRGEVAGDVGEGELPLQSDALRSK